MAEEGVPGRRGYPADFKQRVVNKLAAGNVPLRQLAEEFLRQEAKK